jgi:hypothetical protein
MSLCERIGGLRKIVLLRCAPWLAAGSLFVLLLTAIPAYPQFGLDVALITAAFETINSTMQGAVGSPLSSLQSMHTQQQQFQQGAIYPMVAILQAQQSASSFLGTSQQVQSIQSMPRSSAQTPNSQQLEQTMLSGDPNQVGNVSPLYSQVYGPLPTPAAASQQTIKIIDMNDAEAQNALKKAIRLDAMAAVQIQISQSILQQLQTAPPGSASILTAQASAWVLQSNAYSQSGMAELLRTRSTSLAGTGAAYKTAATNTQNLNGVIQNLMQQQTNIK